MKIAADGNNTPEKGLSLDEAFAQLKASRSQAQDSEHLDDENVDVVDDEDLEDEDFNSEDLDGDAEESDDDDQEDAEEDSEESEEDGEEDVWEIEIDGETVEVSTDELHKGYLRHNDYTRKRQADAKQAKDLETEYQGKLAKLDQALQANISQDEQNYKALHKKYMEATDDSSKRNLHYQMLQVQQNLQHRKQALGQADALLQQAKAAEQESYWKKQEELLQSKYEDWGTKKEELKEYLQKQGFEDLSMFAHADMAEIVEKAKQFDELQLKRETVVKKKIRRKVPKVMKSGQGEKKFNLDKEKIRQLEARFAKSGKISDAQALMRAKRGK